MLRMLPTKQSTRNDMGGKRMHSLRPLYKLFVVESCAAIWDCYIPLLVKNNGAVSFSTGQVTNGQITVLALDFCGENVGTQKLIEALQCPSQHK